MSTSEETNLKRRIKAILTKSQPLELPFGLQLSLADAEIIIRTLYTSEDTKNINILQYTIIYSIKFQNRWICRLEYSDINKVEKSTLINQIHNHFLTNCIPCIYVDLSIVCALWLDEEFDFKWFREAYRATSQYIKSRGKSDVPFHGKFLSNLAHIVNNYTNTDTRISPNIPYFLHEHYDSFADWVVLEHEDFLIKFNGKKNLSPKYFERKGDKWAIVTQEQSKLYARMSLMKQLGY